jgi:SAM-dependent methyltransferase
MAIEHRDWYDTPLYYDIIFDADTPKEATFLNELWRLHARTRSTSQPRCLEAACGSGRLMAEMLSLGWRTHGFDLSPTMLDHARQRLARISHTFRREAQREPCSGKEGADFGGGLCEHTLPTAKIKPDAANAWLPQAAADKCEKSGLGPHLHAKPAPRLWQDAMQSFTAPAQPYHLVHCLVSTFKYLLTEADAQAALRRMADALLPGGLLVLGLHLTDYQRTTCEHERWVQQRHGIHVVCNTRTWPPNSRQRSEQVRTRLKITHPGQPHRTQETRWTFRTYSAAQLKHTLAAATPDLQIVACHDFNYRLDQTRAFDNHYADLVLVLRKPNACNPPS